jgi:hypothetical protein
MKRILWLIVIGLGLGAAVVAGTRRLSQVSPASASVTPPRGTYATEQEWIVSDIANTILNVAAFARHEPDAGAASRVTDLHVTAPNVLARFSIERGAQHYTIDITEHLWAPGAFVAMARELIGPATDSDANAPDGRLLIDALTDPTAGVIQSENVRVSRLLAERPRSPALHEQAALLLGALALRENASILSDPRVMMARMTGHLAVARALSPDVTTLEGRLAGAVLLTLVNRQRDALAGLESIDRTDPSPMVAAWTRALRVRITKDWRIVSDVGAASLLEQRETLRAAHITVGSNRSLVILDIVGRRDLPDWGRIIFHESPSVEAGNRFAETTIAAEVEEAFSVRGTFPHPIDGSDHAAAMRALNVEPQKGPAGPGADREFWIIDWGTWAAASQRHLAAGIVCTSRHLRETLGLPEKATEMDKQNLEAFGDLRLYPLVAHDIAAAGKNAAAYTKAAVAAGELARQRPDLVTDGLWTNLRHKPEFAAVPDGIPLAAQWFAPYFPVGTGFDPRRVYFRVDLQGLETLKNRAPYERDFVLPYVDKKFGAKAGLDVLQREIGVLAEYDLWAAWTIARAATDQPEFYVPFVSHIAETMTPDDWYNVAEYLADHGRDGESTVAFERYRHEGRDQVWIANRTEWFAVRLFRSGEQARALAVAKDAADAYSYRGLVAYAVALDMAGQTAHAETLYREAATRYSEDVDLLAFLMRHQAESGAYAREARDLGAKFFPRGIEQVSATGLSGAPDAGLRIGTTGVLGEQAGLKVGDVLVGVDGTRIRDRKQYVVMKYQSWKPEMRFLVWRDGKYVEVPTTLRHRWVVNGLQAYPKQADAG